MLGAACTSSCIFDQVCQGSQNVQQWRAVKVHITCLSQTYVPGWSGDTHRSAATGHLHTVRITFIANHCNKLAAVACCLPGCLSTCWGCVSQSLQVRQMIIGRHTSTCQQLLSQLPWNVLGQAELLLHGVAVSPVPAVCLGLLLYKGIVELPSCVPALCQACPLSWVCCRWQLLQSASGSCHIQWRRPGCCLLLLQESSSCQALHNRPREFGVAAGTDSSEVHKATSTCAAQRRHAACFNEEQAPRKCAHAGNVRTAGSFVR